jgi:AraC-like DNA-binding protein
MHVDRARIARCAPFDGAPPIELLRATYVTHRFAPHAHDELAVGLVESGAVRTRIGAASVVVPAGSMIAVNPGEIHTGEAVDRSGYRYRMMYLGNAVLSCLTERLTNASLADRLSIVKPRIDDPGLAARFARAHASCESNTERFETENLLVDAIGELVTRYGTPMRAPPDDGANARIVRLVRDYLEEQCTRVVTLAELATLTGLSPFYVSRIFRAAVGVPPYAYLSLVRVRRARELIARGHPPSAVTHEAGFSDQSHFTKQFKRVVGMPPGQYAREISATERASSARLRAASEVPLDARPSSLWPVGQRATA